MGWIEASIVTGELSITNGTDCKVSVEVQGYGGSTGSMILRGNTATRLYFGAKLFEPKAFITAYSSNSKVQRRVLSYGHRQPNGVLLHRQIEVIKIEDDKEFVEGVFEYIDESNYITYAKFSSNVSQIYQVQ